MKNIFFKIKLGFLFAKKNVSLFFEDIFFRLYPYEVNEYDEDEFSPYEDLIERIKFLEEENTSIINEMYRLENSLDARIDILMNELKIPNQDITKRIKKCTNDCKSLE